MGDDFNERMQLQNGLFDDEKYARERFFSTENYLNLNVESIPWILNHVDCFVNQSRGNVSVEILVLRPYSVDDQDSEVWTK
jgi:hypothetical protein